jgi:hypothetical protein
MIDAWIDRVTIIEGTLWQVLGIVLLTFVLDAVLRLIFNRIARRLENTRNLWDDALLESARKPIRWTIMLLGILWAAEVVGGDEPTDVFQFVDVAVFSRLRVVELHRYRRLRLNPSLLLLHTLDLPLGSRLVKRTL